MESTRAVERALEDAAPHLLVQVLTMSLQQRYGASAVRLRLVDHAMRSLQPVGPSARSGEPAPVANSPQGRAFGAQEPYDTPSGDGETRLHLPVTFRGDRLGVLSMTAPADSLSPSVRAELQHICTVLAREILLAGRETDQYEVQRRAEHLTLAAEMQWLLLPSRSVAKEEFELGAQLEPAYAVFGDGFDWSVSADHLTVAVVNGMGQGMDASLLTALAVNAVRNARRAGLDLAGQAALADEAVYAQHRGNAHVAVLLLRFSLATGRMEVVDAGSPHMWRLRGGTLTEVRLEAQMPLGMFGDTHYESQELCVEPKDRLLIASDGVYAAVSAAGEVYGERGLERAVKGTRLLPPAQVPAAVLSRLAQHQGESPLSDDAVVMCVDWLGRRSAAAEATD
ncbi:PP2C family protein-serine/threonine phosphatase [Streptomyces silvensis]|uniref:Phosphatase n=1 Tax=Streptomyces silvensis TaxID=1765722 RepID=A0A0W7X8V8_9ACTN|nr:PP2C family protein-serine/threonine phosphatase [Streptomyces silvensis]KUF19404.1 phosphatase [Streptomyces silvensis]